MPRILGRDIRPGVMVLAAVLTSVAARGEVPWVQDLDEGLRRARDAGQDVMLVFTGRGWCGHCMILEREVFKKPEFLKAVGDQYVFVELDFTFGDSEQEKAREKRLRGLAKEWLVSGYPTVVLIGADSRPYAQLSGYDTGSGVERYLNRVVAARAAHQRLIDRPNADALAGVAEHFDVGDRHDDAFLMHYAEEVKRVLAQPPSSDKSRKRLARRLEAHKTRDQRETVWRPIADRLTELSAAEDWEGVIGYINETLPTLEDPFLRDQLARRLLRPYEQLEDYESALAVVCRLRSEGNSEDEAKQRLIISEARLLRLLGRVDEAIALFDNEIHQARNADLTDRVQWLLDWKLQLVIHSRRFEEAIAVSEVCRQVTEQGSEDWLTATYIRSLALRQVGRFGEALQMSTEQFEAAPQPYTMVDLAECCFGAGKDEAATAWLAKAEAEVRRMRESPRPGDQALAQQIATRLESIRQQHDAPRSTGR